MTNEESIQEIRRAESWTLAFAIETAFVRAGGSTLCDRDDIDEILASYKAAARAGDRFEALASLADSFGLRLPRIWELAAALKIAAQIIGAEADARGILAMSDYDPEDITYGAAVMVERAQSVANQCQNIVKNIVPAWENAPGSPELTNVGYRFPAPAVSS